MRLIYVDSSVLTSLVMRDSNSGKAIELTASQDTLLLQPPAEAGNLQRDPPQRGCGNDG